MLLQMWRIHTTIKETKKKETQKTKESNVNNLKSHT